MRKKVHEKEKRITEELELTKVKSLVAQECASLNDSVAENEFLKKDLGSFH
jgi:hypothetical protein